MMQGAISPENQAKLERFDQLTYSKYTSLQRLVLLLQASALFLQIVDQALEIWRCSSAEDCPAFAQAMNEAGQKALQQIEDLVKTVFPEESFLDLLQSQIWDSEHLQLIAGGRMSLLQHVQRSITTTLAQNTR